MAKGKKEIKYVYRFGGKKADGKSEMKNLLGGKGANLAEMTNIGIPVPPGFTITTEMCTVYYKLNRKYPKALDAQIRESMKHIEKTMGTGAEFGSETNPLLVSVRSGARVSMPGMMDTVLNLGLNDKTVVGLAKQSGNERFAWDAYRRFVQMYGDVVLGLKPQTKTDIDPFEEIMDEVKKEKGIKLDVDLKVDDLKELVKRFKAAIKKRKGMDFPEDPWTQLWGAVEAVFGSWMGERAIKYRQINKVPHDWGTAVSVQAMVFGNMGNDSGTGVAFTRNPSTGEHKFYGEYLINAQGEDVVAGIRTPQPVNNSTKSSADQKTLEEVMPVAYKTLEATYKKLEKHYRDMQDIEFTIQKGKLWMLQTRNGKRTAAAALQIACDMVAEKLIDSNTALLRISPSQLDQLLHPTFDPKAKKEVIAKGLPASPGAATGQAVFHADEAEEWVKDGKKVILVRIETSPEDIGGMNVAEGILTARGGMTSHAAVVARGMGKCCVAGCGDLDINYKTKQFTAKGIVIKEGDWVSIDGSTGEVMKGKVPTSIPQLSGNFGKVLAWADKVRKLGIRTNADTPKDAQVARDFGAEGIGLCRTEHMFFEGDRIKAVREMILADDLDDRKKALAKLLPMQKGDFIGIFEAMKGLPVTIRLLDPPLHEFVPHETAQQQEMANEMGVSLEHVQKKVDSLHEFNPMLGHRGCRLGIIYPEITEMQAQAIIEAACELKKKGVVVKPEIMVPLVGSVAELKNQTAIIHKVAKETIAKFGVKIDYMVGTMIEVPRAALVADKIAEEAEFFSFGTNDLTQMTMGLSRDDAGKFLPTYVEMGIYKDDPFQALDQEGVGQLVAMAAQKGRSTKKDLKLGICGEHGGDPSSIEFCHKVGLNYVSCSPYRVPIARLAAAQAVLKAKK
ncbi:pyruvate, phosphate dikinase [candidate division WOR-1 bacterium RIFOXYA12_FULL_52_29]|uniref:Pyruvate, phosphate dikinase n=1 Tax=candidate division WOR-1 bacterium RIFOXYC12_FULL_54_18 TaxID=1802584 RepID=A0A1F4T7U3_UNCSA|nr:MAG: pyruvate, phosphate dikinase [candidate division WOR-1 bacterium RIFOXYA2_FULL_51_19]OGC18152.1 MAG: pyruvate, phosphate dikinase [candidate division WOR-1 bacterium RIFOXYA12_FULL_52_29]OGC27007.1 MAG: pyruvate, phosphate dikinase [candidate division WOR-1 bacterium RIFOXYB2_FULL_45_9]OGC28569.1 MAG: pyruvate, phosphate dikinase [candidate division WOR-1 bacterium RIFOXYC12_FULL_54_18]OGC30976.1 MAG: pyruvate, phosphate dikinase [candidate division WOR-1 bacterium RIFOXYB12_FULL_52_16]